MSDLIKEHEIESIKTDSRLVAFSTVINGKQQYYVTPANSYDKFYNIDSLLNKERITCFSVVPHIARIYRYPFCKYSVSNKNRNKMFQKYVKFGLIIDISKPIGLLINECNTVQLIKIFDIYESPEDMNRETLKEYTSMLKYFER